MDSDLDAADLRGHSHDTGVEPHHRHQHHQYHLYDYDPHSPEPPARHHLPGQNASLPLRTSDLDLDNGASTNAHHYHAFNAVNPDNFYKSYRALQHDPTPDSLPMASSSVPRPSLRSNGDGTTPRHPIASPNRTLPRPTNVRAASNPVDTRAATKSTPSGKPSVKDLKKRFDQSSSPSSIPSAPAHPSTVTRARRDVSSPPAKPRDGAPSYSTLRSGVGDIGNSSTPSRSQRPKFVAEDQVSNNPQSFAGRVGKPRRSLGANSNASRSMTQLTPDASPQPPPISSPTTLPSQRLLFGEILPEQCDTSALGFGIESLRPRGLSESDPHTSWGHQRSLSDPDIEPSSPSSWYRNANTHDHSSRPEPSSATRGHGRSLSDVAMQQPSPPITRKGATRNPASSTHSQASTSSKLPLLVRKLGGQADSSSPESTRSNSPSTLKRYQANGRTSRATTPTSRAQIPTSRAKTPTQTGRGRKGAPEALPTPNSNARLQAYIAAPPPRLSPPLRSSRPRQPVSMATTASSRLKAVEKPKNTNSVKSRAPSRTPEPEPRRRKISVGPIDFEQRREHIRLAYSRSVRESQALEARKRAADRRRQELEAVEKAKVAAKAPSTASSTPPLEQVSGNLGSATSSPVVEQPEDHSPSDATISPSNLTEPPEEHPAPISPETPTIPEQPGPVQTTLSLDSPALGIPGSFPAFTPPMNTDEPPPSAVSTATETTEFDNEAQTHFPTLPSESSQEVPITIVKPPSPQVSQPIYQRAEYQYPFEEEPDSPEKPTSQDTIQSFRDSVSTDCDGYSVMPGAFGDDYEPGASFTTQQAETMTAALPPLNDGIHRESQTETMPFPRIEMQYESDCHSDLDDVQEPMHATPYTNEDAATDACTEDTDDQGQTEECHSESHFDDQLSAYRASSCASSDVGDGGDVGYPTYGYSEMESNELLAPPSRPGRLSQHSQWTDLTVDSPNPSDLTKSPDMNEESPTFGHVTIFGSSVLSKDSDPIPREPEPESPILRPSYSSTRSSGHMEHQHLPEVDPGDDFTIPYLTRNTAQSSPYIPSPDHEPPSIPTSISGSILDSMRTSSGFYEQSQYGSTMMNSGRGSEDFMSQMETPQTIGTSSLSTSDQYFGAPSGEDNTKAPLTNDQELTDKERHRLVQRRNVMKELVDTEAVFVRDMNIVEEIYKGTAEACPKLDSKTIKQIFRNTDEIIAFHSSFLAQVKEAVSSVYIPKSGRSTSDDGTDRPSKPEISDANDREISLGPVFRVNIESMKTAHEGFLRSSDQAAKRLIQIQQDPTVKVWLNECNEVAKELTAAWDLDSLLIKPMQRITKYPNLIITILQHTPQDHPDRKALMSAKDTIETAIIEINKTKKNFELVGQIVGRKRKESEGKGGFARAFGKRVDKLQATGTRPPDDPEYAKLNEKFGDDYLRLQVVLRDVEFYTRQVSSYVREFLQYLSSVELVMRLQPGNYPEIESKWVQFNISIRDLEKVALEDHLAQVRKQVIEPFELVIKAYGNPSLAMKKRQKRRLDYERMEQLKQAKKSADSRLQENVEQYEALNDTLKKELPKLSALTEKVGNICLGNFVAIQTKWFGTWKDKMKTVLGDCPDLPDLDEVVSTFQRDFPYVDEQMAEIGILSPAPRGRPSLSTAASNEDALSKKTRSPRPSDVDTLRSRGLSTNGDTAPSLPTPDFMRRNSGSLSMSPTGKSIPSPHQYYYKDYYAGIAPHANNSSSAMMPEMAGSSRSLAGTGATASTRPSTGRSFDSGGIPRQSTDSTSQHRRDSNTTYNSSYPPQESRRFSGLFHSALPLPDGPEESRRSSRASSRERGPANDGYNVLWLAASLFEFNIATTKHEAGYPYLIYQAGEVCTI